MLTLFAQYYIPKDPHRRKEVDLCFLNNIKNPLVSTFVIYFENEEDMHLFSGHKKVVKRFHPDRMTYAFWLKATDKLPVGEVSILVNADIYLTESISHLLANAPYLQETNKFIALSRYNPTDSAGLELNKDPHWTQDTWGVVKSFEEFPSALLQETAFELGHPGCDNKIAYVMSSFGFSVTNPCHTVVTVHLQKDEKRSYHTKGNKLLGLHAFVYPTNNAMEEAVLEYDLLTRNKKDPTEIRLNNWINDRKSFVFKSNAPVFEDIKSKLPTVTPLPATQIRSTSTQVAQISSLEPKDFVFTRNFNTSKYSLLISYSNRLKIYADESNLFFYDAYWPTVYFSKKNEFQFTELNKNNFNLFAKGFLRPVLNLGSIEFANELRYKDDVLFWQYPAKTEADAYLVHSLVKDHVVKDGTAHIYIGLPWATFIDKTNVPESIIGLIEARVRELKDRVLDFGLKLKVHTVCQHIFCKDYIEWFKKIHITDLWLSHKVQGQDSFEGGINLHAWHLYPVNYSEENRRNGLITKPIEDKKYLASFVGAYMPHYLTKVRTELLKLGDLTDYFIEIKNLWHFNDLVYKYQVKGEAKFAGESKTDEVFKYNDLISNSIFSLCPSGAGRNSIRIWESMAVGTIPVILADGIGMPDISEITHKHNLRWEDAVVFHPEISVDTLDSKLRALEPSKLKSMQAACIKLFSEINNLTAFGNTVERKVLDKKSFTDKSDDQQITVTGKTVSGNYATMAVLSQPTKRQDVVEVPAIDHDISKLALFKHQQLHCVGQTVSVFNGEETPAPAVMEFKTDVKEFLLWFDKTERVSCIYLSFEGKPFSMQVQGIPKHAKVMSLNAKSRYVKPNILVYEIEAEEIDLCLGLKFSTQDDLEASVLVSVTVDVFDNYYAKEFKRLDQVGFLKAMSDSNQNRKDHIFDTEHIDSGKILKQLLSQEKSFETTNEELYPSLPPRLKNLVDEDIKDGITMYVHLMNRNENVQKNIANWLNQKVDELILLDWSSTHPVAEVPGLFDDPRVRVVRVEGQKSFIRTLAQNLATQMARNKRVFKLDSDVEFKGDFFGNHPLKKGYFWVGNWMQGRDFNERHLHGETYYHLDDFFRVNGYDERIVAYGQDDTNLKDRMVLSGCERRVFSYNFLEHQHHDQALRSDNQIMIHPMVRTYQNRFLTNHNALWSAYHPSTQYTTLSKTDNYLVFEVAAQAHSIDVAVYENDAIDLIASWYLPGEKLKAMNREEKVQKIWELQVE
jgi:hypothetical protein